VYTSPYNYRRPVLETSAREGNTGNRETRMAIECFLVRYGDALAVLWHWSSSVVSGEAVKLGVLSLVRAGKLPYSSGEGNLLLLCVLHSLICP
jgi:hypothetical protein